jgi:hypothetical protein
MDGIYQDTLVLILDLGQFGKLGETKLGLGVGRKTGEGDKSNEGADIDNGLVASLEEQREKGTCDVVRTLEVNVDGIGPVLGI